MEGYPANPLVPPGYINSFTPFFFPQPQITQVLTTPSFVYVSPEGSDDPANVGSVTSPFATISNALFYVTTVSPIFPVPLSSPVCIFVAPGIYTGGFSVPDNVYLIGPSNSPAPVVITSSIFASPVSSSSTIGLMNLTLQALEVAGAFYDVNVDVTNCVIQTETIFSALTIAPLSLLINVNVHLSECVVRATDENNANLISAIASELVTLTLDRCELVSEAEEGEMINMIGNLTIRNSSLTNIATSTTLDPLIVLTSGATLVPVLTLEGSVLKYTDLQTDVAGNKLALKFDTGGQPITASMTNCTISVHLGAGETNIVKNIGGDVVTLSQSANSCLLDGRDIDTTNITLTAVAFLQDTPGVSGAPFQATYYKSANQNLVNGSTDITFDLSGAWSNAGGYITHTDGTTAFTVVEAGLYQLEWNTTISANGATWVASPSNKFISIDVVRSPTAEQAIIGQSAFMASGTNYAQSVCSTFNLEAGDVINCRVVIDFTGGPPRALALANTIDLNTWFTWRFVGSGSGGGGVGVLSASAGTGIGITGTSNITIENTGVLSITNGDSTATGIVTLENGTGIEVTSGSPGSFVINNTLPGFVATGTISQTGFTQETVGPATGQYFKTISIPGMWSNGIIVGTTSGTPAVCASAWITTIIPIQDFITIWVDANPVSSGETWEAHYVIASFGTAPP
jgi:hypothetical protein